MTGPASKNAGDREVPMASMMEMMPKMMQGMMSQCCGEDSGKMAEMQAMMANMTDGGSEAQMPEMMLNMMLPHCIEMMFPKIDPEKRGATAAGILAKIIEKGSEGMSNEQAQAFRKALDAVVNPST